MVTSGSYAPDIGYFHSNLCMYLRMSLLSSITTPRPEGEGVVIDDKPWQLWYKCYISYLIG